MVGYICGLVARGKAYALLQDAGSFDKLGHYIPATRLRDKSEVRDRMAYFMLSYGTGMILLANPDSHFSVQKSIYIIGDAGLKTQNAEDCLSSAIQSLESCVLSLAS